VVNGLARLALGMLGNTAPWVRITIAFVWITAAACEEEPPSQGIPPKAKKKAGASAVPGSADVSPTPPKAVILADLDSRLQADPTNRLLLMQKAAEDLQQNAPKRAMVSLKEVTLRHPTFADAYLKLAALLSSEGKRDEATHVLETGIAKATDRDMLLEAAAHIQARAGQSAKGSQYIARILEGDPTKTFIRLRYAKLLATLADWKNAHTEFVALAASGILKPADVVSFATVLHELGHREEALKLLRCSDERPTRLHGISCGQVR
jgi:predicted Zn-dependent protease